MSEELSNPEEYDQYKELQVRYWKKVIQLLREIRDNTGVHG